MAIPNRGTATLKLTPEMWVELLKFTSAPGELSRTYTVGCPLPADTQIHGVSVLFDTVILHLNSSEWSGNVGEVKPIFKVYFQQ